MARASANQELVCPQAPPGQAEFLVSIPPGVAPGTAIQTTTPDGQLLTFAVPDDFVPGQMIPVFYTPLAKAAAESSKPATPPPAATKAEMRAMFRTFRDAKDKWKIDGQSLKGFYLRSETGYLYCWDQPKGILHEYEPSTGQCQAVWSSAVPGLNAEIWTVLPLPPTDPAAMQAAQMQTGCVPNIDVYLILTVAHEEGRHLPSDVLAAASEDFCSRHELQEAARKRLRELPAAGQHFVIQNFRPGDGSKTSKAFLVYVEKLLKRPRPPWGSSACTLVVNSTGATIGRSCPDLDALCRDDPQSRLAQAHCNIMSEQDRFFVRDLNTSLEGTLLDGFAVNDEWVGPLKNGSLLTLGPLRIRVHLSEMAQDEPLPSGEELSLKRAGADEGWQRKVYQKTAEDDKKAAQRRAQEYKDRAELRRERSKGEAGSIAIDTLVNKFERIKEAEKAAEEAEERRVDAPTMEAHREANMSIDGTFLGGGGFERAGIGFHAQFGAELIPNVPDPRSLSPQEAARLKTQQRFNQASGR
eukprot:TRINITY_DN23665_c0_g2_i1.p1 TRINITY_DN23665_c0_g2~~TRINITY_DN23665_c0_g2_i1.p1  ORF type:complete len:526 (-),score=109.41 TRINITY_DN23665_c0_g2_i1:204-1781(-)